MKIPRRIQLSQWADEHGYIPPEASSYSGPWRTSNIPYLKEILDSLSDPFIHAVNIKASAQSGKSACSLMFLAYIIAEDPGPFLWIHPNEEAAERFSKERVQPMFRDTPVLRGRVAEKKGRESGNTIMYKVFLGGRFRLASAKSAIALAQSPERYIILDDISNFDISVKEQGSPFGIIEKRSRTFPNRKIVRNGTPTVEGTCWASYYYEKSDQRKYYVPCPECKGKQILDFWKGIKWDFVLTKADELEPSVHYECEFCKYKIPDSIKIKRWMLDHGEWRADKPNRKERGYWISALYWPGELWKPLVEEFLSIKHDPEGLRQFKNLQLGETWREEAESAPEWSILLGRKEGYEGWNLPSPKIKRITMGVDVQMDRFVYSVVGWGADFEAWILSHGLVESFEELDRILENKFEIEDKKKFINLLLIDAGYRTDEVYEWVFKHSPVKVRAVKGEKQWSSLFGKSIIERGGLSGKPLKRYILWHLDTYRLRMKLFRLLNKKPSQKGFFHMGNEIDEQFVRELTNERLVLRKSRSGRITHEWEQIGQNHYHDAVIYALAGAYMVGVRDLIAEEDFLKIEEAPLKREEPSQKAISREDQKVSERIPGLVRNLQIPRPGRRPGFVPRFRW
jgi:phage terminase large subunit GpA-like protein